MKITLLWLGTIVLGISVSATAADSGQGTLAVLPLFGDAITLVGYRPSTGTHIDLNEKEALAVPADSFDRAALEGVRDASARSGSAPVVLLPGAAMHVTAGQAIDGAHLASLPELAAALAQQHVTRLVVLTARHAPTHLRFAQGSVGSGELEGLGFYVDPVKRTRRSDTGERGTGFLAGYAYFDVTLIDVPTSTVLGHRAVEASATVSGARSPINGDPWDALNGHQKVAMLRTMVRRQTAKAVVELLGDTSTH